MEDRYLLKAKRADNGEWMQGYLFDDAVEIVKRGGKNE